MLVKDLMRVGATSIAPTASVLDAAALMANTQASALPVVDQDGRLLGIVSEADLIDFTPELNAEAKRIASNYKLGPLFTPPVVSTWPKPLTSTASSRSRG